MKEQIVKTAYEVNKTWCELNEDNSFPSWEEAPEWQKESLRNGVDFHIKNPDAKPEDSHNNWMKVKFADGWVYGEIKDVEKKTHPCMVPYSELSFDQKVKDYLFITVVKSFQ